MSPQEEILTITHTKTRLADILHLAGPLTMKNTSVLREEINEYVAGFSPTIALDMGQCPYIDSAGLGILALLALECRKNSKEMRIYRVNLEMSRMFRTAKLDRLVQIRTDSPEDLE